MSSAAIVARASSMENQKTLIGAHRDGPFQRQVGDGTGGIVRLPAGMPVRDGRVERRHVNVTGHEINRDGRGRAIGHNRDVVAVSPRPSGEEQVLGCTDEPDIALAQERVDGPDIAAGVREQIDAGVPEPEELRPSIVRISGQYGRRDQDQRAVPIPGIPVRPGLEVGTAPRGEATSILRATSRRPSTAAWFRFRRGRPDPDPMSATRFFTHALSLSSLAPP